MEDRTKRLERQREPRRRTDRPDRVAMWAFVLAVAMMMAAVASARASSGGIGSGGTTTSDKTASRYSNLWDSFSTRDRRWAHRTSDCESGGDPKAIGGGGKYHGAFQFTLSTWRRAPKTPGGDPVDYTWTTQAVVAVALKHRVGTSPWPRCG
jgi:resuscitation-promoting factor RpfB